MLSTQLYSGRKTPSNSLLKDTWNIPGIRASYGCAVGLEFLHVFREILKRLHAHNPGLPFLSFLVLVDFLAHRSFRPLHLLLASFSAFFCLLFSRLILIWGSHLDCTIGEQPGHFEDKQEANLARDLQLYMELSAWMVNLALVNGHLFSLLNCQNQEKRIQRSSYTSWVP